MKVLIACEYSARVRDAFRKKGHDAWSVDILATEGDPAFHFQEDVTNVLHLGWDLLIGFPPCTDLSKVGAKHWPAKRADGRQQRAFEFVKALWNAPIDRVCIENPAGWLNTNWMKPHQYVQPFQFGEPWKKFTCLWLRGLPKLVHENPVEPKGHWVCGGTFKSENKGGRGEREGSYHKLGIEQRQKERNRTFQGIANAMANQWS